MPSGIYKRTEETRKNISEARKGIIFSEEHKQKLSESHKGKKYSEETKKKMSEAHKGERNPNFGKYGKDNPKWRNWEEIGIRQKHTRMIKLKPKPKFCEICGKPDDYESLGKLQISNKDHKYNRNLEDWRWIHAICHSKYDYEKQNKKFGR